jgi:RNA polymerase sigma factor (sigma-70 family)
MDETCAQDALVTRLQAGDEQAAADVFARYARRLAAVAQQHLSRKLAGREDGEDIVQSVFRTFFRRSERGDFQLDESAQLWRLLVKITVCKARAHGRFHSADKRNVHAEMPATGDGWLLDVIGRDPGPDEAVVFTNQIETLLTGLPALHGQVLDLRLQGIGVSEIATRLDVSRQTVYRALDLLQQRLTEDAG